MQKQKGFTLIEVMVVVAIIAILAMVAIPAYQRQVIKSNRVSVQAKMMELAGVLERNYTQNGQYVGALINNLNAAPNNCVAGGGSPYNNRYDLCIVGASPTTPANTGFQRYTITATRVNAQLADSCGNLTLNSGGVKGAARPDCWR